MASDTTRSNRVYKSEPAANLRNRREMTVEQAHGIPTTKAEEVVEEVMRAIKEEGKDAKKEEAAKKRAHKNYLKKLKPRLPEEFIAIPCPDKGFHEKWYPGRSFGNITHPFRGACVGPPGTGKSTLAKQIIARVQQSRKPFERIIVVHTDAKNTKEWPPEDGYELRNTVPSEAEIGVPDEEDTEDSNSEEDEPPVKTRDPKTLIILDDVPPYKEQSKVDKAHISRILQYVSTHRNVSVFYCTQSWSNVSPSHRRNMNVFVIWGNVDKPSMKSLAARVGLEHDDLTRLFAPGGVLAGDHDSLLIDLTNKNPETGYHPGRLRKNVFDPIILSPDRQARLP